MFTECCKLSIMYVLDIHLSLPSIKKTVRAKLYVVIYLIKKKHLIAHNFTFYISLINGPILQFNVKNYA